MKHNKKVIDAYTYEFLKFCKKNDNLDDILYFLNSNYYEFYYNYEELYKYLINVLLKLSDESVLKDILYKDIPKKINNKKLYLINSINYEELCNILIKKINDLPISIVLNNNVVNLYVIDVGNNILSINEYNRYLITKNSKIKTKH